MRTAAVALGAAVLLAVVAGEGVATTGAGRGGGATLEGSWTLRPAGSFAGYRIREQFAGIPAPNDAVGRTSSLTGLMTIQGGKITTVDVDGDPRTLKSDKSHRDQTVRTRVWGSCPHASFHLVRPLDVSGQTVGVPVSFAAVGDLTLRCRTRRVSFPLKARWDGDTFEIVGQLSIRLADYGLRIPRYARLLSVSKTGKVEVKLVWVHQ